MSTQRPGRSGLGLEVQRAALALRKTAGIKLGNPTNAAHAASLGRVGAVADAERFAIRVLPTIASIQRNGTTSMRGIAVGLNERVVRTAREGQWQVSNVRNILVRAE